MNPKIVKFLSITLFIFAVFYFIIFQTKFGKALLKKEDEEKKEPDEVLTGNNATGNSMPIPKLSIPKKSFLVKGNIKRGDKGNVVKHLQAALNGIEIDGSFGPGTEARLFEVTGKKQLTPKEWYDYCFINPYYKTLDSKQIVAYDKFQQIGVDKFVANNPWYYHLKIVMGMPTVNSATGYIQEMDEALDNFAPWFKSYPVNGFALHQEVFSKLYKL